MKLRIAPEHIRFRISKSEFNQLLTDGVLINTITLSNVVRLDCEIRINSDLSNEDGQILKFSSQTIHETVRFHLSILKHGINRLQSDTFSKDGIQEHVAFNNGDLLTIGIEIDLHSKDRKDQK